MTTTDNDLLSYKKMLIALFVGSINVLIGFLSWQGPSHPLKTFVGMLNVIPFAIAFIAKNYGHEIDFTVYYLFIFLQWFLLTWVFFIIRRKLKNDN